MAKANGKRKDLFGDIYFALCKSVDSPLSLGAWLRYKHREHLQLAEMSIKPSDYLQASAFRNDYLIIEYPSKYKGLETGVDTEAVALQAFITSEASCHETNQRFKSGLSSESARVHAVLHSAARKISSLLGPEDGSWQEMCKWGPGATSTLSRRIANLERKFSEDGSSVTVAALPYAKRVIESNFQWLQAKGIVADGPVSLLKNNFKLVQGSTLHVVDKNAKTGRVILIEPTLNTFLQGGVGMKFRQCLRLVGINLEDQTANQRLAAEGARNGLLATVDVKGASDHISYELVYSLFPFEWASLLDDLRSRCYMVAKGTAGEKVDSDFRKLSKFSSMGNGFTFEMETLIFWALSQSCEDQYTRKPVKVYGDDIIVSVETVPLLTEVLTACGFAVNAKKTHWDSQFRESCGKHYYGNEDVSPIYQKEELDALDECYRASNRLRRLAFERGGSVVCDKSLHTAWLASTRGYTPSHFVPLDSESDEGLALPLEEIPHKALKPGLNLPIYSFVPFKPKKGLEFTPGLHANWHHAGRNSPQRDVHWWERPRVPSFPYMSRKRVFHWQGWVSTYTPYVSGPIGSTIWGVVPVPSLGKHRSRRARFLSAIVAADWA